MTPSRSGTRCPPNQRCPPATRRRQPANCGCPVKVTFGVRGVVSPLLANLFLHYVFDLWMRREYPDILFERYADDAICHCRSEAQALELRQTLEKRFADRKLQLHPEKTKVVYCKDANRPGQYPERSFDFLGYTFRPRLASNHHGARFVAFIPA